VIHEQVIQRGAVMLVECRRDDVETIYLLKPTDAAECSRITQEAARWRCIKASAFAQRKRKEGEDS
jgi:hypothetical protein